MLESIFLDFNLPNAATWFYFSLLLTVALFFQFNRLLSLRNWDLLTLFLLVPGLLLLQEGHARIDQSSKPHIQLELQQKLKERGQTLVLYGYIWLISGSGYLWFRCLFDLALIRRPALSPNLNLGGMAWMAVALLVCLTAVALRRGSDTPQSMIGRGAIAIQKTQDVATAVVSYQRGDAVEDIRDTRFWVERTFAMVCQIMVVVALILIGKLHFQDTTAGMAAAAFYLLLPYTAYHVSQVHHVWPATMILWAIYTYRKPTLTGVLLGLVAGTAFFPLLLLPLWWSFYRRRGAGRFVIAFFISALAGLLATLLILWWEGDFSQKIQFTLSLSDWQPWRVPETESLWTGIHWAYRLPVFILFVAFVVVTSFWPSPKNLAHVIALSAAILIGIQFWYSDQGGVYVLWYLPMLALMTFRPNLVDRQPPAILPESDWIRHWGESIGNWWRRRSRSQENMLGIRSLA